MDHCEKYFVRSRAFIDLPRYCYEFGLTGSAVTSRFPRAGQFALFLHELIHASRL